VSLVFKDDDTLWVKTEVMYWDLYDGNKYQWLGLDTVTLWDLNKEENRKKTRKGDYVEDLEQRIAELEKALKFYADGKGQYSKDMSRDTLRFGKIARAALGELNDNI